MIHYHGTPITPDRAALEILKGRHGLVSFARPEQIELVAEVCQSFVLDNGAFTAWKHGGTIDRASYYEFVNDWHLHPGFDWAVIPDVIDGTEADNDALVEEWPFRESVGVPVWHLHESIDRLLRLVERFDRVSLGSSGQFAHVGSEAWHDRMAVAMRAVCISERPIAKLHGLRMLNPRIFGRYPFASADSTNIARNIGLDERWSKGAYPPPSKAARGILLALRIENTQSASEWNHETTTKLDRNADR